MPYGAGADPNAVDKGGVTPLQRAVRARCASAVSALLEGGSDPQQVEQQRHGGRWSWRSRPPAGRDGIADGQVPAGRNHPFARGVWGTRR